MVYLNFRIKFLHQTFVQGKTKKPTYVNFRVWRFCLCSFLLLVRSRVLPWNVLGGFKVCNASFHAWISYPGNIGVSVVASDIILDSHEGCKNVGFRCFLGWDMVVVCLGWCMMVLIWSWYMHGNSSGLNYKIEVFHVIYICYVYECWIQACMFWYNLIYMSRNAFSSKHSMLYIYASYTI